MRPRIPSTLPLSSFFSVPRTQRTFSSWENISSMLGQLHWLLPLSGNQLWTFLLVSWVLEKVYCLVQLPLTPGTLVSPAHSALFPIPFGFFPAQSRRWNLSCSFICVHVYWDESMNLLCEISIQHWKGCADSVEDIRMMARRSSAHLSASRVLLPSKALGDSHPSSIR